MAEPNSSAARSFDWLLLALAVAFADGGFYLALVSLGLARSPSHLNGPNWLGFAAGLVLFAAGLSVLLRAWLRVPDKQSNLPDDAPAIAVAIQWLATLTIIVALDGSAHDLCRREKDFRQERLTGPSATSVQTRRLQELGAIG